MYYYEVIPATGSYHGKEALTYGYEKKLDIGTVVQILLRAKPCLGIVSKKVLKPDFKTVNIDNVVNFSLNKEQLKLMQWMMDYYPAPVGTVAQLFAPSFIDKLGNAAYTADTKQSQTTDNQLPNLTDEQLEAYNTINSSKNQRSFILYGITGSGKTRLYMELVQGSLAQGKSVIILTPEISLTAPIASQFQKVFGDTVMINHSSLTQKKRLEHWSRLISSKGPFVIIGPRSSLFMPVNNIGLIVVDEFHEPAYKQESQPFYHANRVASVLSQISSSKLIFGSATPPVIDYFLAEQKNVPIIKLEKIALTGEKPQTKELIVNMLDARQRSAYSLISKDLIDKLSDTLNRGEQAMVFINKRGSARSVSCQDCGYKELCKNCDLPMVYHSDQHSLRCHTCGFNKQPPKRCPECGSMNIFFSSPGTKAIAESLAKIFPKAKILRFDKDNKKSERMENRYDEVMNDADIIVGTQIIAKGHDLPKLSLVAMLLADSSLDFPDYTSEERSYQLIKQLAGRINRGHRDGLFIIQTFSPGSKFLESVNGNWEDFYKNEIKQRKLHGFPPFYSALKIEVSRKSRVSAERALSGLLTLLEKESVEILGPSPSFVEKKSSNWHWQAIIKSKNRTNLVKLTDKIPGSFKLDIDPNNFL